MVDQEGQTAPSRGSGSGPSDDGPRPPVRVQVLGEVRVVPGSADRALGGGQARELLALLVAHHGQPVTTAQLVDALWPHEPPATAATIVHGLVRRIRRALGHHVVTHDDLGYRLQLDATAVDLWNLDERLRAGDLLAVQRGWRDPAFGAYHHRPWAQDALAPFASVVDVGDELRLPRSRRRVPVSRLVGRRRELSTVAAAARRSRLVTIVGLGGVGKTRLALEVLRELRPEHDAHVDIGAAAGPAAARIATQLGLAPSGDPERDLRAVASLVGRRSVVLLLDGCEHDLQGSAHAVEALLGLCPDLRVTATSRVTLGVPGEHVVPLLPFSEPGDPRGDAVELLLDRAQALGLSITEQDRVRAAEVSERCAGVPLAIELGVTELLLAADANGGSTGTAAAHPSGNGAPARPAAANPERVVDEVISHALDHLSEPTRRTAVRLSLLVAGFNPDLVAAVAPEGSSATGILHELVASGLVVADTAGPTRRLRFLDRVREHLGRRVADHDVDVVLAALLAVFQSVRPDLTAPLVIPALVPAVAELPNGQALLEDLAARRRPVDRLVLATAMADTWAEDGQWAHGERELRAALAAVRPAAPGETVASLGWCWGDPPVDLDATAPVPVDRRLWLLAMRAAGAVSGTYEASRRILGPLSEAAELARADGELLLEGHLRLHLAHGHGYDGDLSSAYAHLWRLAEIAEALDEPYVHVAVLTLEGLGALVEGDHGRALEQLRRGSERLEELGAPSDAARIARNLGVALRASGQIDEALQALDRAERLALRGRARGTLATIRTEIVDLQALKGEADPDVLLAALDAVVAVGNLRAIGVLRSRLGELERDPATVAVGVLELLDADRRWAAAALATLLGMLPTGHPLHERGPAAVRELAQGWGIPLDAAAEAVVAPYRQGTDALPDGWEPELRTELRRLAAPQAHGST